MWVLDKERLRLEVERQGMTSEALAEAARLEPWQLRVILEPHRECRDPALVARLASALGIQPMDISLTPVFGSDAPLKPAGLDTSHWPGAASESSSPNEGG
jgi:hypothetical protein